MDHISGLPAHPLLVHIPVVLLPLAAVGVVVMALRRAWYRRYRWATLAVCGVGMVGAVLSANAGESLEAQLRRAGEVNTWEAHAEAGDTARAFAIVFFVLVAMYVLVPWFLERRAAAASGDVDHAVAGARPVMPVLLLPILSVVALAGAVGSVVTVIDAGHSGAKSVWHDSGGD